MESDRRLNGGKGVFPAYKQVFEVSLSGFGLSVLYRSIQKVYSRLKRGEPSVMLKAQWPALYNTVHVWNVRICMACHFGVSALFPSVFLRYFLQLFCAVGGNYL